MSSGDTPYYTFQYPNPITSYNTLQIGQCEIDACGTTALKTHGDILLDGSLWSMDECAGVYFSEDMNVSCTANLWSASVVKIQGSSVFSNSACLTNISGCPVNILSNTSNINISGVHVNVSGALMFNQYNTNSIGIPYTATPPVSGTTAWYLPGRVYMTQVTATAGGTVYALAICP
jgi:hypothetical protein